MKIYAILTQQQDTHSIQVPIDCRPGDTGAYPGSSNKVQTFHGLKVRKACSVWSHCLSLGLCWEPMPQTLEKNPCVLRLPSAPSVPALAPFSSQKHGFAPPGLWIASPLGAVLCHSCSRASETAVPRPSWLPRTLACPPLLVAWGVGGVIRPGSQSAFPPGSDSGPAARPPAGQRLWAGPHRHCVLGNTTSLKVTQSLGQAAGGANSVCGATPSLPRAPGAYALLP
ncbi:unnamed protein product [Rangifer tarandus platyrhynchus]|uniref:Uncharacterized protein n=1 Tax=Rangifer tarandus platyrhynchus TaxID=3082113 RepID=A0AC59Z3U8_RANTA